LKLARGLKILLDFMLFCGFDLLAPVTDKTTHYRFRNVLVKGGIHDDLLTGVCRQIRDHGAKAAIIDTTAPAAISVPTRKHGGSGTARKYAGLQDNIQRLCPPGRGPDWESFIDRVHKGHLRTGPGTPGFDTMVEGAKAQARTGRQGLCQQGQPGCPARSLP